ncbi:MAG: hypothetical protein HY020_21285 [Burkholderiales bacterium]|nr:hypothetical protein [Burkholderiales bacterium]
MGLDLGGAGLSGSNLGSFAEAPIDLTSSGGAGWLQTLTNGLKGAVPSISQAVGGGGNLAALIGAGLGAASGGGTNTATTQSRIDPRMEPYVYGTGYGDPNSILGAGLQYWQQNKTGLNPTMQQGLDMQRNALTDPAYGQAYTQMRNVGQGLLSQPIAGNPFTSGQPQAGGSMSQAGGVGGLLGGNFTDRAKALMTSGRGLLAS